VRHRLAGDEDLHPAARYRWVSTVGPAPMNAGCAECRAWPLLRTNQPFQRLWAARGERAVRTSFLGDARAGLAYMWRFRIVRTITLGYIGVVAFNGIDDVALVFLATDALDGGESAGGLLLAAVGLWLIVGYALLRRGKTRMSMIALLVAGGVLLDVTGPRVTLVVAGTGGLLVTLATALALRRRR
jgi:hypothetical protein